MRFYCDANLRVTSRLQDIFQHLEHQAEYHIRGISEIKKATLGDEYVVLAQWEGLDEAESTWEPVSRILEDAPAMLKKDPPVKAVCCGQGGTEEAVWLMS